MRFFALWICLIAFARAGTDWQPVVDLSTSPPIAGPDGSLRFDGYGQPSHFAGDTGFSPGKPKRVSFSGNALVIKPGEGPEGIWASLAGAAEEAGRLFDPTDLLDLNGLPQSRVPVTAVTIDASGHGKLRVELADATRKPVWSGEVVVNDKDLKRLTLPINADGVGKVKFLTCTAGPGADVQLRSLGFQIERPAIEPADWLFRISLGKLRRCLDGRSGLVADRGHTGEGRFLAIPSSGFNALATAVAAKQGLIDPKQAAAEVRLTAQTLLPMKNAHGFLPHFANREADGRVVPSPKSEYSSVDTAIALESLLLAADVLALDDLSIAVRERIRAIDWEGMFNPRGYPCHGYAADGKTRLTGAYRGWGGEQALTVLLESMGRGDQSEGKLNPEGRIFHGVGFIVEIQSLLHPDFDQTAPDQLSGISWPKVRRKLAEDQAAYFIKSKPECPANKLGLWGLSAGAGGMPGAGYAANGCDLPDRQWIHPHYPVMAAMSDPARLTPLVNSFDRAGLLFPRGLPEAVSIDGVQHNPLQSSLNAAFEVLAAYHAWKRPLKQDVIDQAGLSDPLIRRGMARFYPKTP